MLTFLAACKEFSSVTGGFVFGITQTIVMPPANAAAVPEE